KPRARVSKDEDGQDAGPSCFETHRSAAESAQASVFARAAMLLSMRTERILAKRRHVGEPTCGCGSRPPAAIHCFRTVIYNEPATPTCRAQARRCRSQAAVKAGGSAHLRQRLGLSRGGRVGEMRYDFGRKQPHGLLGLADIERAEIDLQRGVLEPADRFDD